MSLSIRETWYPAKNEKGIVGRFDLMEVYDVPASQAKGAEVFKKIQVVIVKAHNSGDYVPQKVPTDPVARQKVIARFPEAWAAFQGEVTEVPGTSLDKPFKGMSLGTQQILKFHMAGVSTWEQVAELSDQSCDFVGFGTQKIRNDTMTAMGRTPPGKPVNVQLMAGMTARDALMSMEGGDKLVAGLERMIAEKTGESPHPVPPSAGIDVNSPAFQAAVQAAVSAILATQPAGAMVQGSTSPPDPETLAAPDAPAGKKGGWPKGAKRGPDGKPVLPDVEAVST